MDSKDARAKTGTYLLLPFHVVILVHQILMSFLGKFKEAPMNENLQEKGPGSAKEGQSCCGGQDPSPRG